jgi:glycosyltransferase involved in cell wall biosynthesis
MKRSVIIIAHNEGSRIEACLLSVLNQTLPADEIIVVAHNCTDETASIARNVSIANEKIAIDEYAGSIGIIHARIRGINLATGDRIFCIDGDASAKSNWIEELDQLFEQNKSLVLAGSFVNVSGPLFWKVFTPLNRYFCVTSFNVPGNIWGSSFAFPVSLKKNVVAYLTESEEVAKRLGLVRNPDDYWLALRMRQHGTLKVTNRTEVFVKWKQSTNKECLVRNKEDISNGRKMLEYFKSLKQ